ncbi:MAG: fatty acid cis/trans isomerase [Moraxellaceae bacterium]|nr:fatty acid cis/trans isomerase [Moraxellaceae bacterium]
MLRPNARLRNLLAVMAVLLLAGCASLGYYLAPDFNKLFGPAEPARFDHPRSPPVGMSYAHDIQPILDKRCVVCHACYDAACQMKTTSWEGLARGASKTLVYDPIRLLAAAPSRLYVDADKTSEWRKLGFSPVLNERAQDVPTQREAGLMYRLLTLKQQHPLPDSGTVGGGLDFSIDRAQICPADGEIEAYEKAFPLGGMPYGLPGLAEQEHQQLTRWLEMGAPYEGTAPLSPALVQKVNEWEAFFNGDSLKERLFARYAYEHLFLAALYFDEQEAASGRRFFRLVRSTTPPGQPVREVRAARPVDDPGVERPYYRLIAERESIVAKTHMPYRLDAGRMAFWRKLFLDAPFKVTKLPGYSASTAANPFATFAELPADARYRFMLQEAHFTISGFIKGPVCRGQMALNVIEDQFWVVFAQPGAIPTDTLTDFLAREQDHLSLPTGRSTTAALIPWVEYAARQHSYLLAKSQALAGYFTDGRLPGLGDVWDGSAIDGGAQRNDNAVLSIFRHNDSATVVKGLVGDTPKTAWLIEYPLLERIHYLLVANYDVYGNVGHQLNSRLYMDFLRMEGEFNFLLLLPQAERVRLREYWYRGSEPAVREQVYGDIVKVPVDSAIRYQTREPMAELLGMLRQRVGTAVNTQYNLAGLGDGRLQGALEKLADVRGAALSWLPENSVLAIEQPGRPLRYVSLLRNTGHLNVSHLMQEAQQIVPAEHTLTVAPGVVGAYLNALYRVREADLPAFTAALAALGSEADYTRFSERFAVRRTNPRFWAFSDALHEDYRRAQPVFAGILDYNRLENR